MAKLFCPECGYSNQYTSKPPLECGRCDAALGVKATKVTKKDEGEFAYSGSSDDLLDKLGLNSDDLISEMVQVRSSSNMVTLKDLFSGPAPSEEELAPRKVDPNFDPKEQLEEYFREASGEAKRE